MAAAGASLGFKLADCRIVGPLMDLVAVGNPELLVEVKAATRADKQSTETMGTYCRYFGKARSLNLFPTLAIVRVTMENRETLLNAPYS